MAFSVTTDGIFVPRPRSCSEMLSPNGMEFGGASLGGDEAGVGDPPSGVSILIKSPQGVPQLLCCGEEPAEDRVGNQGSTACLPAS